MEKYLSITLNYISDSSEVTPKKIIHSSSMLFTGVTSGEKNMEKNETSEDGTLMPKHVME